MTVQATNHNAWGTTERAALLAAASGFAVSFVFLLTHGISAELRASASYAPTSLDATSFFLSPSSILLLGAQSAQGTIVLSLLSAFLNAGYYTFAMLLILGIREKFRSVSPAPVLVASDEQRAHVVTRIADHISVRRTAI